MPKILNKQVMGRQLINDFNGTTGGGWKGVAWGRNSGQKAKTPSPRIYMQSEKENGKTRRQEGQKGFNPEKGEGKMLGFKIKNPSGCWNKIQEEVEE